MWSREEFDSALPTLARYCGLILTVILTGAVAFGHNEVAPGFVPAAGLMLYKSVRDASLKEADEEKWTHLP